MIDQQQKCKQVQCEEAFNKEFWDYTFIITAQKIAYKISDSFYGYLIKEDSTGYHVGCTLPKAGDLFDNEYDRCQDAIALYSEVYKKAISKCENKKEDLKKAL